MPIENHLKGLIFFANVAGIAQEKAGPIREWDSGRAAVSFVDIISKWTVVSPGTARVSESAKIASGTLNTRRGRLRLRYRLPVGDTAVAAMFYQGVG